MRDVAAWIFVVGAVISFGYAIYSMFLKKEKPESLDTALRKMSTGGVPKRVKESSRLLEREPVMTKPTESDPDENVDQDQFDFEEPPAPAVVDEPLAPVSDYQEEDEDEESDEDDSEFEEFADDEHEETEPEAAPDTVSSAAAAFGMDVPLGQKPAAPLESDEIEEAELAEEDDEPEGIIDFPPPPEKVQEPTGEDANEQEAEETEAAAETSEGESGHEIIDFPPPPAGETAEMPPPKGKTEEVDLMQNTDYSEYEDQWAGIGPKVDESGKDDTDSEADDFFRGLDEDLESSYEERQRLSDFESEPFTGETPGPGDETKDSDTDDGTDRHENVRQIHAGEYIKKGIDPYNMTEPPKAEAEEEDDDHVRPTPADISQTFHRLEDKADTEHHKKEPDQKEDTDKETGDDTLFG